MSINFPDRYEEISKWMGRLSESIPDTMGAFTSLHHSASEDNALSKKTKELIALSIAVTVRCDGCIAFHVHDALEAGASKAEIAEAVGVAVLMGGGPSVVYGCEALEAVEQFSKSGV